MKKKINNDTLSKSLTNNILVITNVETENKNQKNYELIKKIKDLSFDSCFFVDGGFSLSIFKYLKENKLVKKFYFVGDKDSVDNSFENDLFDSLKILPKDKDDTDLNYAFKEIEKVVKLNLNIKYNLVILNFFLGRMSMSLANLQSLLNYSSLFNSIEIHYYNETKIDSCYIINKEKYFDNELLEENKRISFISLYSKIKVSIKNFKYDFEGFLTNKIPFAVSNEFLLDKNKKPCVKVLSRNKHLVCFVE